MEIVLSRSGFLFLFLSHWCIIMDPNKRHCGFSNLLLKLSTEQPSKLSVSKKLKTKRQKGCILTEIMTWKRNRQIDNLQMTFSVSVIWKDYICGSLRWNVVLMYFTTSNIYTIIIIIIISLNTNSTAISFPDCLGVH